MVASASVRVTFVDLTALGARLGEVARRRRRALGGPGRRRRPTSGRRGRGAHGGAARDRARAYPTAVGLQTAELRRVSEPGLRTADDDMQPVMYRSARAMESAVSGFELRPEGLESAAEVTADFTAS